MVSRYKECLGNGSFQHEAFIPLWSCGDATTAPRPAHLPSLSSQLSPSCFQFCFQSKQNQSPLVSFCLMSKTKSNVHLTHGRRKVQGASACCSASIPSQQIFSPGRKVNENTRVYFSSNENWTQRENSWLIQNWHTFCSPLGIPNCTKTCGFCFLTIAVFQGKTDQVWSHHSHGHMFIQCMLISLKNAYPCLSSYKMVTVCHMPKLTKTHFLVLFWLPKNHHVWGSFQSQKRWTNASVHELFPEKILL